MISLALLAALAAAPAPAQGVPAPAQEAPAPAQEAERPGAGGREDVSLAIHDGLAYLLEHQNEDGSWGGPVNQTFTSGFANPATYRMWQMGTTGLSTRTLLEHAASAEAEAAVERGLDYLIEHADAVRPAGWDVDNNWALVYGLDAVARALQHPRYAEHERRPALVEAGQTMIAGLAKYQSPRGGWGYYSSPGAVWQPEWCTSFMTAAAILSLVEARAAGLEVDDEVFDAAVRALERARLPSGAFEYSVNAVPRHLRLESINQIQGSLGRIQVGHLALRRAGREVSDDQLVWGLEQFVKHHKFLVAVRNKPIPHEGYYANAAYFYLFAHYYAAQVVELLPGERRGDFPRFVQTGILDARQQDGAMWDFWIASDTKAYGTSFGVMGLETTLVEE